MVVGTRWFFFYGFLGPPCVQDYFRFLNIFEESKYNWVTFWIYTFQWRVGHLMRVRSTPTPRVMEGIATLDKWGDSVKRCFWMPSATRGVRRALFRLSGELNGVTNHQLFNNKTMRARVCIDHNNNDVGRGGRGKKALHIWKLGTQHQESCRSDPLLPLQSRSTVCWIQH